MGTSGWTQVYKMNFLLILATFITISPSIYYILRYEFKIVKPSMIGLASKRLGKQAAWQASGLASKREKGTIQV
jgi:hypothetical protein